MIKNYLNFIKHRVYDFEVLSNFNDKKRYRKFGI
jgi:hypothetical protein